MALSDFVTRTSIRTGMQVIPNAVLGGNIIAILAQQAFRSAMSYAVYGLGSAYVARPVFVAGVPVSARTQEAYQLRAEATRHAVEAGAIYTDHVILEPIRIDLSFEVTNWEDGFAEYADSLFTSLWKRRQPLSLLTEHRMLTDMVLIDYRGTTSVPNWGALECQATFQQIKKVTLETAPYTAADVKPAPQTSTPDASKSAEPPKNTGQQTPLRSNGANLFNIPDRAQDVSAGGESDFSVTNRAAE